MLTVAEMKEKKKELHLTNRMIAQKSGVPEATVQKVFSGETKHPRYQTMEAIEQTLNMAERQGVRAMDATNGSSEIRELSEEKLRHFMMKGPYTVKDYLALPENRRVEMIDGVFFDMASPSTGHQRLVGELFAVLRDFLRKNKGSCVPFVAPTDVELDEDGKTIVQPDVMVVCDREKIHEDRIHGAPDLVIEVLSPSTAKKDRHLKMCKYLEAGVREYWLVDPKGKHVVVYLNDDALEEEAGTDIFVYGFDQKVPVAIFHGACEVDFTEVYGDNG